MIDNFLKHIRCIYRYLFTRDLDMYKDKVTKVYDKEIIKVSS